MTTLTILGYVALFLLGVIVGSMVKECCTAHLYGRDPFIGG